MASVIDLAQDFYDAGLQDAAFSQNLRSYHTALLTNIASGDVVGDVVQGSKNSASYTVRPVYSIQDRLLALKLAISGLDRGVRPSNIQRVRFY